MKWHEACLSISAAILEILNAWENGVLTFESIQVGLVGGGVGQSGAPALRPEEGLVLGSPVLLPSVLLQSLQSSVAASWLEWGTAGALWHRPFGGCGVGRGRFTPRRGKGSDCALGGDAQAPSQHPHIRAIPLRSRLLQKITDNIKGKVCSMAVCAVAWLVAHVRMLGLDEREKSLQMIRQLATPLYGENTLQFYNER